MGFEKGESKFKKGDRVYCNTSGVKAHVSSSKEEYIILLSKDKPYVINDVKQSNIDSSRFYISIKTIDGRLLKPEQYNTNVFFERVDFLTEEEYLDKKDSTKDGFKVGDSVYYNGIEDSIDKHTKFKLFANQNPALFDIYINGKNTTIAADFINKKFISENEYNLKYKTFNNGFRNPSIERSSNSNSDKHDGIKSGDTVYYIGNRIKRLKKDVPYTVQYINPITNIMKIDGDICPGDDFLTVNQYEKHKLLDVDNNTGPLIGDVGREKTEVGIKSQIFYDTRENKLLWYTPYKDLENWFRTIVKLKEPKNSYLRIDIYKGKEQNSEWTMRIYYHRDNKDKKDLFGEIVKAFGQSSILVKTVEKIKIQLDTPREGSNGQYKINYD